MALPDFKSKVDCLLNVAIPTFGEEVRYSPTKGGDYRMVAVFDRNFQQVDPDTEVVIASNIPALGVNLNNMFEAPEQGDMVDIKGELFRVTDSQEDGQGGATLIMQKAEDFELEA